MVGKVTFRVDGAREVEAALKALGAVAANRVARSALNRSATPVVKRAKELVPVDTGELRDSITKRLRRHRSGSDRQTILIGVEKPRSRITHLVEFGTAHTPARSFLRASLDTTVDEVLQIQRRAMAEGIDREVRRLAVKALAKSGRTA
jgi:HK97 gp10 family phage protein